MPMRMEVLDGALYFLEHCFGLFSMDANLELVKSIVHDGAYQLWLVEAHQRRVRFRLIRNCETYLLYRASRADTLLNNPQINAEQLLMVAESVVYGPYGQRRACFHYVKLAIRLADIIRDLVASSKASR